MKELLLVSSSSHRALQKISPAKLVLEKAAILCLKVRLNGFTAYSSPAHISVCQNISELLILLEIVSLKIRQDNLFF